MLTETLLAIILSLAFFGAFLVVMAWAVWFTRKDRPTFDNWR